MSPIRRLILAVMLSVIAHAALIAALARPASIRPAGGLSLSPLAARLLPPPAMSRHTESPAPHARPLRQAPVAAATPPSAPARPAAEVDAATTEQPAATGPALLLAEIPPGYSPLSQLTRAPELTTPVNEDSWPDLPDAPTGSFQLELAIGSDGRVDIIVPHCTEALCPAAHTYAGIVSQWHFQPAEILGLPVPSRLRLEFEVGFPADAEAADDSEPQPPRQ